MSRFLVLGAGFVAEPLVEFLNRKANNTITVASHILQEAKQLANKYSGVNAIEVNVNQAKEMASLIANYDLVVSLVPAPFHPLIARACIDSKVSMVTASYESPEMRDLADEAKQAGISILNEIGLDPGIDHLSAMQIIDQVHAKGEMVETFVSWCGGLPAPEDNNNPLGYKFSWAPKGVLMALLNEAVFLQAEQVVKVSSDNLMTWSKPLQISDLELEGYPNRESVSYQKSYSIPEAKNILRGTLRYKGFSQIIEGAKELGLLNVETTSLITADTSWQDYILQLNKVESLTQLQKSISGNAWQALQWIGCFSEDKVANFEAPIDVFCELLKEKLVYLDDEKDMVVLQHKFAIQKSDNSKYFITSTLKAFGDHDGYSAMSKTVGYPAAIASQLIADGDISRKGLLLPVTEDIYQPILAALEKEGIVCQEQVFSETEVAAEQFLSELI